MVLSCNNSLILQAEALACAVKSSLDLTLTTASYSLLHKWPQIQDRLSKKWPAGLKHEEIVHTSVRDHKVKHILFGSLRVGQTRRTGLLAENEQRTVSDALILLWELEILRDLSSAVTGGSFVTMCLFSLA